MPEITRAMLAVLITGAEHTDGLLDRIKAVNPVQKALGALAVAVLIGIGIATTWQNVAGIPSLREGIATNGAAIDTLQADQMFQDQTLEEVLCLVRDLAEEQGLQACQQELLRERLRRRR